MRWLATLIVNLAALQVCVAAAPLRVGFYNTRNLYDTVGDNAVPRAQYEAKIAALSSAVKLFAPAIVGLCEVENRDVVQDIAHQIKGVVLHYESTMGRGIDVAMVVDTSIVEVLSSEPVKVGSGVRDFLRADLLIKNSGAKLIVYVVHLPSKLGGARADEMRAKAHEFIDSLSNTAQNVIFIGDFNSSPAKWPRLYNAAVAPSESGVGSYAYRDVWTMIDQVLISRSLLPYIIENQKVVIHPSLLTPKGRYRSYPNRDISDHLPIYLDFDL